MDIQHERGDTKGRYWAVIDGGPEAEMTYSRVGETMIIIDHTEVPEAYRGQNVGVRLVERAVHDARAEGLKVMPLCPFAAAQFRRHKDWQDVLS